MGLIAKDAVNARIPMSHATTRRACVNATRDGEETTATFLAYLDTMDTVVSPSVLVRMDSYRVRNTFFKKKSKNSFKNKNSKKIYEFFRIF